MSDWEVMRDDRQTTGEIVYSKNNGDGTMTVRSYFQPIDELLSINNEQYVASMGMKFGQGIGDKVASIPMNVFFDELAEPIKQKDKKYFAKWLNDLDHSKFRTFRGKV